MLPKATFDFSCLDEQNSTKGNFFIFRKKSIVTLKTFEFTGILLAFFETFGE